MRSKSLHAHVFIVMTYTSGQRLRNSMFAYAAAAAADTLILLSSNYCVYPWNSYTATMTS
eukprot:1145495-Pelagomonas_calceolata.AAC.2